MINRNGISYTEEENEIKSAMKNGGILLKISDNIFRHWLNKNHPEIYDKFKLKHCLDSGIWRKTINKYPEIKTEYLEYIKTLQ